MTKAEHILLVHPTKDKTMRNLAALYTHSYVLCVPDVDGSQIQQKAVGVLHFVTYAAEKGDGLLAIHEPVVVG